MQGFRWFYHEFGLASIHSTGRNAYLLIFARFCRMFAYGTNSLILAIFFSALGFSDHQIGLFMTLTLFGDVVLGTFITLIADRAGRRNVLLGGSVVMVMSGVIFAVFENFWILLLAAVLGVISITGGDFGPFRNIEESILSQLTTPSTRSDVLAWYVTISLFGSALGSEGSGRLVRLLEQRDGWTSTDAYHALFWVYAIMGLVNALLVCLLSAECELESQPRGYSQVPHAEGAARPGRTASVSSSSPSISRPTLSVMFKLWFLLAVDSTADGMVPYSMTNYFMDVKFHPEKSTLGDVQSVAYLLGALSAVFAGPLARKIGLINTMVFTHTPSSAAVLLFPFPPVFWLTAILLFVRSGLNNMDQAPRTAFIAAVVKPEELTAVMGITGLVRTLASMAGPTITGLLAANDQFWIAYVAAGACRLAYDFGLYAMFVNMDVGESAGNRVVGSRGRLSADEEQQVLDLDGSRSALSDSSDEGDSVVGDEEVVPRVEGSLALPHARESVRSRSPHRHGN